jgi:predicted metal-binding protein
MPKSRAYYTLIFAIAALNLFVDSFLNLALENTSSCRLVEPCYFEYMCRIDPIIRPPSHNTVGANLELIHRNTAISSRIDV